MVQEFQLVEAHKEVAAQPVPAGVRRRVVSVAVHEERGCDKPLEHHSPPKGLNSKYYILKCRPLQGVRVRRRERQEPNLLGNKAKPVHRSMTSGYRTLIV